MTSDDLHRTNINLLKSDVEYLREILGFGWTEKVREIVHVYVLHAQHGGSLEADDTYYESRAAASFRDYLNDE